MPWEVFLEASRAFWARLALDRMNLANAIGLAFAGKDDAEGRKARADTIAEAYPDG